jgi:putative glutamine amidotransferase
LTEKKSVHTVSFLNRSPVIGITSVPRDVPTGYGGDRADTVALGMVAGVVNAGGVPLMLPVVEASLAPAQLDACDALILAGGQDLDLAETGSGPDRWIDPPRDRHEFALWDAAQRRKLPVLGICRGLQLVNVALGGSLQPHLEAHNASDDYLEQPHPVQIEAGTRLSELIGLAAVEVNTIHHQSARSLGDGLVVSAQAPDGVIEAAELVSGHPWFIGVQWHPELMLGRPGGQDLFDAVVRAASGDADPQTAASGAPPSAEAPVY